MILKVIAVHIVVKDNREHKTTRTKRNMQTIGDIDFLATNALGIPVFLAWL